MILPLSDAPNPRGVPIVNYVLIAANVAVFLLVNVPLGLQRPDPRDPALREYVEVVAQQLPPGVPLEAVLRQVSAYDLFVFTHGFRPAAPELVDLFSSMFLHGGFMHLFGNMLFLWIYGDNVEARLGRLLYLLAYLATGVAATLFFALFDPRTQVPLVGASGAISGVLGFYFLWFPRNTVRLWVFLFPFFMNVVQVPARLVLGLYLVVDNLLPFLVSRGGGGGIAHGAHIGGFLGGLAVAWLLDRRELEVRPSEYRQPGVVSGRAGESIRDALARGDYASAAQAYFALDAARTRRLLDPAEALALADWLATNGHPQAALVVYRRLLRDYPRGPGAAEAHVGAGLVQLHALGQLAPAYQHFLDALDFGPSAETAEQARAGLAAITARQRWSRPH